MALFGYVKFQVCLKSVNISFEPDFGNPRFETPQKMNVVSQQLLILLFGSVQASAQQRNLEF